MNNKRVERMIREVHTYPMPSWVANVAGWGGGGRGLRYGSVVYALVLATSGLALTLPSHAQDRRELVIHTIVPDGNSSTLVLEGRHFVEGSMRPLVHLVGIPAPLPIARLSEGTIMVKLPASLPAANYLVRVSRGTQPGESDQKAVDLGIVGPVVSED